MMIWSVDKKYFQLCIILLLSQIVTDFIDLNYELYDRNLYIS